MSDVISALRDLFARQDSIDSSSAFSGQLNNLRSGAVDFSRFRGKVDTRPGKIIMTGHSFGSATVLEVLKDREVKHMFERGICLDPVSLTVPFAATCVSMLTTVLVCSG